MSPTITIIMSAVGTTHTLVKQLILEIEVLLAPK